MSRASPANNQLRAVARRFTSVDEYVAFSGLGGVRVNRPPPRDFSARMAFLDLGVLRVRSGAANVGLSLIGTLSDNHIFTFATEPARARLMTGREVPDDAIFCPRPNEMFTSRSQADEPFPWASIAVNYAALAHAGPGLAGRDVSPSRLDASLLWSRPAARARLIKLIADAERVVETTPEVADSPAAATAFAGVLLDALIQCLGHAAWEPDRAAARSHHRVMARFHSAVRENSDVLLSRADLCRAVGASERTLHEVCMNFVGMAPMRYVRRHRLGRVRDELLIADPQVETVTQIALRHGFWDVGRFGSAYRETFGEAPSATLRRGYRFHGA